MENANVRDRADTHSIHLLGRPLTWLSFGVAGLLLISIGVTVDAYRHNHGASAGELVSFANPGMLLALTGTGMAAAGLLTTLSLLAFQTAGSAEAVVRRGIAVAAAWMSVAVVAAGALTYIATADLTISHHGHNVAIVTPAANLPTASTPAGGARATEVPGAGARVTLQGTLTLDGAPLEAEFLGARVTREGLAAACQSTLPPVTGGRYEIKVLADTEGRGCGGAGAEILLWAFTGGGFKFSREALPWPGDGATVAFNASFSSGAPEGAARPTTEFYAQAKGRDGSFLPGGTLVEAYVGDVLCGIASARYTGFEGFTLIVAGPEAIPGCVKDATLTFRIEGQPAVETAVNDLRTNRDSNELLVLTVQ